MDIEGGLKSDLAEEMESLRDEILRLQKLFHSSATRAPEGKRLFPALSQEVKLSVGLVKDGPPGIALADREYGIVRANHMFADILGYGKIKDITERKASELKLLSEKSLPERIINSSADGVAAFDNSGRFTVWNPGMESIFGISARETLGLPVFLACPFFKTLGEDVNFEAALKGKKVLSKDRSYTFPDSSRTVHFEASYGPIHDLAGERVTGGFAVIRDITDRRLAEQASRFNEERYGELFENACDIVYSFDLDGKMTSINKTAERILGYSREEALTMNFLQFVAPEYHETAYRALERQIADEMPVVRELALTTRDGGRMVVEVGNRLIFREGKPCGIQGIARDIGERKKTEAAMLAANKKLENRVRELDTRVREMTLIGEMGDILRACLTPGEIYDVIASISRELFPDHGGELFVLDPARNIMESAVKWGNTEETDSIFTPEDCWALRRGKIHCVDDTHVGLVCRHIKSQSPGGYLCVPMMAQSSAVGVLRLSCPDGSRITESMRKLAMEIAERVAMAVSNLRMYEALRGQSVRDPLTGLFNRSFMTEALDMELRRAVRAQNPLSFLMMSIDRFQTPNHAPDAADFILRKIGALLQSNIRKGDIACRCDGHTFIVILPQTPRDVGLQRAEIFCRLAGALEMKGKSGSMENISISVGAAMFPEHGETVDALVTAAENAVGAAGRNGGGRVIAAE